VMVFFVAVNTTIILILLLPVMISKKRHYSRQIEPLKQPDHNDQTELPIPPITNN
jgi:hypothetical protein